MGSGSRCNRKARKRKGFAVKSTTTTVDQDGSSPSNSASTKKKLLFTPAEDAPVTVANDCKFVINSDLLMSLILMIGHCPDCAAPINIDHLI